MKFRRRLIGAVTAVTLVTLGSAFAVVFYAVYHDQQHQLDVALLAEAHEEALEAAGSGSVRLAISSGPGPLANDIGPLTKYGAIYDFKGRLLDATDTFRGRPPVLDDIRHRLDECFDTVFGNERLRAVLVPLPLHDGVMLLLAAPRLDLERDAAFLRRAMSGVFVVAVIWAMLVATWIVRRLTRGHEAIARVARLVAAGDLNARVEGLLLRGDSGQLARDINQMIDRLSTLLTAQQEFIVHAAHELRSPLTLLYGELSLAARRSRDAADYRRAIEEALLAARSLKALAEDLLVLARIGAVTDDQSYETIDILEMVRGVVALLSNEAETRKLLFHIDGECRPARGRHRDLERVFRNVVENAIRHSPAGGTVAIRLGDADGAVAVSVSDQGDGIAEVDRERIFEPFYRGPDDISELPGFGMGLAIARKITRAIGGDITLDSTRPAGAQFVIRLQSA